MFKISKKVVNKYKVKQETLEKPETSQIKGGSNFLMPEIGDNQ